MKLRLWFATLSASAMLLGNACVTPPSYPIEPVIGFKSLSKDTLNRGPGTDSTLLTITFTDGDGDIGSNDTLDIFRQDSRDGTVLGNQVPFVPELGASNGIKGEISIIIPSTCCIPPDPLDNGCTDPLPDFPYDLITYKVFLFDRAKHKSNVIEVPLVIRCF